MTLRQSVRRGDEVLALGDVTIACVHRGGVKPRRLPAEMVEALAALVQPQEQ